MPKEGTFPDTFYFIYDFIRNHHKKTVAHLSFYILINKIFIESFLIIFFKEFFWIILKNKALPFYIQSLVGTSPETTVKHQAVFTIFVKISKRFYNIIRLDFGISEFLIRKAQNSLFFHADVIPTLVHKSVGVYYIIVQVLSTAGKTAPATWIFNRIFYTVVMFKANQIIFFPLPY